MKYKAIICDLDGTLIDSVDDIGDSCNHILKVHGYPVHPIEDYKFFVGSGAKVLLQRTLPRSARDEATVETCLADFREYYADHCEIKTFAYDGIVKLLHELSARHMRIAVLTNKPQLHADKCVNKYLSDCGIEAVIGFANEYDLPPKPDPSGALKIAALFNIPPEHFLFLGDTSIDMKTATAAGMIAVGVGWGFRPVKEMLDSGAKHIIDKPMELLDLLD
jgi:phosphoglycolate phosphatase